jgi:nucleotide-binding universal stress UspA family protein/quercetin dioxygenase-like cupin family protein
MPRIRTILHPTDFSENARCAFETACAMARENGATLIVLHVMAPDISPLPHGPLPDPMQSAESQGQGSQFPWPRTSDSQIRVEHRLAEGGAADEILRLSNLVPCDLIVMGTHGRSGVRRFLTGSVAEEVLRKAACPVLVARIPLRFAPEPESEATAGPGQVFDARPAGTTLALARTKTLVHTTTMEVIRQIVPAGQEISEEISKGEMLVHCLEGRIAFTALGKTQQLKGGQVLHFPAGQPYACQGIEDACILLTTLIPGRRHA